MSGVPCDQQVHIALSIYKYTYTHTHTILHLHKSTCISYVYMYVSYIQKLCFLSCIKALGHVKHNKMHFLVWLFNNKSKHGKCQDSCSSHFKKTAAAVEVLGWKLLSRCAPCGGWQSSLALPHKALESLLAAKEATRTTQNPTQRVDVIGGPQIFGRFGSVKVSVFRKLLGSLFFVK